MALTLTAVCTNTTGLPLLFQSQTSIHGHNPSASAANLANGAAETVTATPEFLGPSPEGTFIWQLSNGEGQFVFAYDLHDDPISFTTTGVPAGYAVANCAIDASGNATVDLVVAETVPTRLMTQIKTIVFLMLENRSLDNVLGWLQPADNATYFPPGSGAGFDGLQNATTAQYGSFPPVDGTTGGEPCRVPAFDPYEPMAHVQVQMYASGSGTMPSGYFWANPPPMSGFAWDYDQGPNCTQGEVMGAYSPAQLPVLSGLATHYAVSDRWFSSVPSQTDPNRAFSVCGTSLGKEDNAEINDQTFAATNTIFNVLGAAGKSWGLFWNMDDPLGTGEPGTWSPYTSYYFPKMQQAPGGSVQDWSAFLSAVDSGTLPNFCYVEPYWGGGGGIDCANWIGIQGNDYHPPAWVGPAEDSLNTLFAKLTSSPQWPGMLLIITFDEHGGTFDHVAPTSAVPPDDNVGASGFKFDRMGVRVPTILVSPYIAGPTVFRAPADSQYDFDHTSFLATFCGWAGVDPANANLGLRTAHAPTFDQVLSPTASSNPVPVFTLPSGYAEQGGGLGAILGIGDAAATAAGPAGPFDIHAFREAAERAADADAMQANLGAMLRRKA